MGIRGLEQREKEYDLFNKYAYYKGFGKGLFNLKKTPKCQFGARPTLCPG